MKRFQQTAVQAAARSRLLWNTSIKKRYVHWFPTFAFVFLGVVVAGPSPALTISPRRLLEVTDLDNLVTSPDGRYVAFRTEQALVERNTYDTTWYVQALDGKSSPLRVADGGAPLRVSVTGLVRSSPAVWSPDGKWIYYRARLGGGVSVWRAAADGAGSRAVTSDPADVRDFTLSNDGKTLKYSVGATRKAVITAEESEYDQGIRIDDTVNIAAGLFRSSKLYGRPTTERFLGNWFSMEPLLAKEPNRWRIVDLATMTTRDLPASEQPAGPLTPADLSSDLPAAPIKILNGQLPQRYQITQNPSDGRIAMLLPGHKDEGLADSRYIELAMLPNRRASHPIFCTAKLCRHKDITDIQWRPGSDEVLFTVTDYDRAQSIYGWNVVTGMVQPIALSDGLAPCALSSDMLVCVAAEADHPPRLETIDIESGHRRTLFAPNKGLDADIAATVPAKLIHWKDALGREFTGQLFEARGASAGHPPPLFINFYHCYGFLRGGVGDEWPFATLAEDGISALCINAIPEYRLDAAARYDQGRAAVESVVKLLSAEGRIDRTRVGMGGLSYGSEVTLWTLTHSNVVTAASVSGVSVTPTLYLLNTLRDTFRSQFRRDWQLGSLEETPKRWREVSPAYQLDRINAPILFQLPEQEYRMTLEYSLPLVRRHQADMYVFPNETHIKFQPRHKLAVYERNVDWFRFWLQGYEDPNPDKDGQYRIWRGMKKAEKHRFGAGSHDGS
ncbi:MAG: Atxe2 family lasso peptide isopeptidase [Rhodanobacter sp.]|nr:MAG: Atxe2 family lasso peptide isopeptidase [Rhodanobacter sp.]